MARLSAVMAGVISVMGAEGDQARLIGIAGGAQAYAMEAGALHIIGMCDAVEAQLVLEQVSQEPGKAPGGQGLATGIIDPGPVMEVEPAVLMLIPIGLVQLVGAPDIHDRQGMPLGIRAGITDECLVGPFGERDAMITLSSMPFCSCDGLRETCGMYPQCARTRPDRCAWLNPSLALSSCEACYWRNRSRMSFDGTIQVSYVPNHL